MDIPRAQPKNRRRFIVGGSILGAVVVTTVGLSRLKPAAPSVERATVWIDSVRRGPLVIQVRGPGTLVPEQIRWISAVTAGRVERRLVQPGQKVEPGTVLLELSNPDVQLEALEAERQLTAAQAERVSLGTSLRTQALNQRATVATIQTELNDARRNALVADSLADKQLISPMERSRLKDRVEELSTRHAIELERLQLMTQAIDSELALQRAQVERWRAVNEFQRGRIRSMEVKAGATGVVQEIPLEVGQWAQSGATLAKVVEPGRLKAVLRIPETQAKDIAVGQPTQIDTRNGIVPGKVMRIDPAAVNGTVTVDIALEGALPRGARPDLTVDGTIEVERLPNVLYVGRPAYGQSGSTIGLFKLVEGGAYAVRTNVQLGRSSVSTVEVRGGLQPGDKVIVSDMSRWDSYDRVRLE